MEELFWVSTFWVLHHWWLLVWSGIEYRIPYFCSQLVNLSDVTISSFKLLNMEKFLSRCWLFSVIFVSFYNVDYTVSISTRFLPSNRGLSHPSSALPDSSAQFKNQMVSHTANTALKEYPTMTDPLLYVPHVLLQYLDISPRSLHLLNTKIEIRNLLNHDIILVTAC